MDQPSLLWHYTDVAGFFGIVNSGRLRVGQIEYLNDVTERTYGRTVVSRALADGIAEIPASFLRFSQPSTRLSRSSSRTHVSRTSVNGA